MTKGYIDQTGKYYDGDKQHPLDKEVPQRPSPFHEWDGTTWVLNQAAKDAVAAEIQRRKDIEDASKDQVVERLLKATPAQITQYINTNVTDLASARAYLVKLSIAVQYALRNDK